MNQSPLFQIYNKEIPSIRVKFDNTSRQLSVDTLNHYDTNKIGSIIEAEDLLMNMVNGIELTSDKLTSNNPLIDHVRNIIAGRSIGNIILLNNTTLEKLCSLDHNNIAKYDQPIDVGRWKLSATCNGMEYYTCDCLLDGEIVCLYRNKKLTDILDGPTFVKHDEENDNSIVLYTLAKNPQYMNVSDYIVKLKLSWNKNAPN